MASAEVETGRVPDVIQGRHRSQKEPRVRRYARKTADNSADASPRTSIPPVEQKRRSRHNGIRNLVHRRQQAALRRSSDSALLPPIRASSSVNQAGESPTHDANETSSPTSNVTMPAEIAGEDHNADGLGTATSSCQLAPLPERDSRSPFNRRETQSMLETANTPRLSPVSDQLRLKAERRITKSVNDTINDVTARKSPVTPTAESTAAPAPAPPKQTVRSHSKPSRRISMQSLPKLTANEEPFSIRRKIEQFRKWHEEQYAEKLKKLKVDGDKERGQGADTNRPPTRTPEIDFTKLLEENMKNSNNKTQEKTPRKDSKNENPVISGKMTPVAVVEDASPKRRTRARCRSGATWRTWRDVNDSYAYDDVEKYIEENELLPADRAKWITEWIGEVEKAFTGDNDLDGDSDDLTIDLSGFP